MHLGEARKSVKATRRTSGRPDIASSRLRPVLLAILGLEVFALGLKAFDDRNQSNAAAREGQDAQALIIAERLHNRARLMRNAVEIGARTGASLDLVAQTSPDIDTIMTLADAARADDPRILAATRTATRLISTGDAFGVSAEGDIVVAVRLSGSADMLAFAPVAEWLPAPQVAQRFTVLGDTAVSAGNLSVPPPAVTDGPQTLIAPMRGGRFVSACVPIDSAQATACSAAPLAWITQGDLARLLFYGLLVLGPALAIFGLGRDNVRQREAREASEAERRNARRLIDLVMQSAGAGNWEWLQDSDNIYVSAELATLLGMSGESEVSGKRFIAAAHPTDADNLLRALRESRKSGRIQCVFRTRASDGRRILELRGQNITDEQTGLSRFVGIAIDVTDRVATENRLKAVESRLQTAIEGFSSPFALWDKRKRLVVWNSAFVNDLDLGDIARDAVSHEAVELAARSAFKSVQDVPGEKRARQVMLRDGRWLKLIERTTPDGGLITIGVDITSNIRAQESVETERARLKKLLTKLEYSEAQSEQLMHRFEEERDKAERASRSKSSFLASVSHELRTPLNAINGFSEILAKEIFGPLGDARYKEYASDILASGQHLLDMINDILDMAKVEAGKMTINTRPIDPVDPVDAAIRMVRHRASDKGLRLTLEADELPMIEADHRAVRQMVLNLVANAIKFTSGGGRIAVTVTRKDNFVRIAVRDSGIGIPKEDLPRLGRPFEQVNSNTDRHFEGTGLGLALTKSFAEMHGGKLTIASELGKGTLVAIYLPLARPSSIDKASGAAGAADGKGESNVA